MVELYREYSEKIWVRPKICKTWEIYTQYYAQYKAMLIYVDKERNMNENDDKPVGTGDNPNTLWVFGHVREHCIMRHDTSSIQEWLEKLWPKNRFK